MKYRKIELDDKSYITKKSYDVRGIKILKNCPIPTKQLRTRYVIFMLVPALTNIYIACYNAVLCIFYPLFLLGLSALVNINEEFYYFTNDRQYTAFVVMKPERSILFYLYLNLCIFWKRSCIFDSFNIFVSIFIILSILLLNEFDRLGKKCHH